MGRIGLKLDIEYLLELTYAVIICQMGCRNPKKRAGRIMENWSIIVVAHKE
ncbi:hypothetical protein DSOL_0715 [Desulfosporosinus metallidurans]|uniref:Uncharacterized protein n=1 Tax=Desulfosporosinus metallidurans TaxID=1888891 RepID=A0A1Q8R1J4_9FIRM|nr:hypothetical protein DSOL_0715 [Desulfosporosinus metallidurans]